MIVGRRRELAQLEQVLAAAREGAARTMCLVGEPGIGKTTLLSAARTSAAGFRQVTTTGVPAELALPHAGLLDVVSPLREWLPALPGSQQRALGSALGWSEQVAPYDRFLVAAATLSLVAEAAEDAPLLVIVDDAQWLDRESLGALAFAARRLVSERVAVLLARRCDPTGPRDGTMGDPGDLLARLPVCQVTGLDAAEARELLPGVAGSLVPYLVTTTGGNPLALGEVARRLTPEQRRGSVPLPDLPVVGERVTADLTHLVSSLPADARRALVLAAASPGTEAGPVVDALLAEGCDAAAALAAAESAGALAAESGRLSFSHPLVRVAAWQGATPAERRSAHASLAAATGDEATSVRHRAQATVGHDPVLARRLTDLAATEVVRAGYASAAALSERAAALHALPELAAQARATAAEQAFLAGDPVRVRRLTDQLIGSAVAPATRARALLVRGRLEQYAGSVPRSQELLTEAAALGEGRTRLQAVAELAQVGYRLGSLEAVTAAADRLREDMSGGSSSAEHEMLAALTAASALAYAGDWGAARPQALRAIDLLETDPGLRDDPEQLVPSLLAAGWAQDPGRALAYVDRRLDAARVRGALGVLPCGLLLMAIGSMWLGDHARAYAWAGEAVELGTELGYLTDVGTAYQTLAMEQAARGLHEAAAASIAEAVRLAEAADVSRAAVQLHLVRAYVAACRQDHGEVVTILEERIAADGGRRPQGDYPLSVAPWLVEAYLALGRRDEAAALVARHVGLHDGSGTGPEVRADLARLRGLVDPDDTEAERSFETAHRVYAEVWPEPFEAARTRLMHGARLRRAGQRVSARTQLRVAEQAFAALGLDGWAARAADELAATGLTARRGHQPGDALTSQEVRVALLVSRGMTNKEVAAALFLSPKTVEHHVTSALRKRGLRSRTQLAAAFASGPPEG